MNKKKLLSVALVVIMIAILSFGTLAWFNDADSVENKFYVATSEDKDPDDIFSVDVWEDTPDTEDGEKDQNGHEYKDILPGSDLEKEVFVENTGYYAQYIRMNVTITNADAWIAALGNGYDLGKLFYGHDETKWSRFEPGVYTPGENGGTYTMTFYLNEALETGETACLFEGIVIPTHLTQEDMVFVGGTFSLTAVAEAVQTENLGIDTTDDICDAYQAFQVVATP